MTLLEAPPGEEDCGVTAASTGFAHTNSCIRKGYSENHLLTELAFGPTAGI